MRKLKIIYMGTPDFAVPCLERLAGEGMDIVCVVTSPDKPVGRKQILTPSDVKKAAVRLGLEVYQPNTLKTDEAYEFLKKFDADFIIVAAYGKILPKRILDLPKYACINIHGSLLPKYRGAAPIQRSVIDGCEKTGVTTMLMAEGLDTGDILETAEYKIGENDTAGFVFDTLAEMSTDLLMSTLADFLDGKITPKKQDDESSTYAAMLTKQEAELDFSKSMQTVHNFIRGMNPWPIAFTDFDGKKLKIYSSEKMSLKSEKECGTFFEDMGKMFVVCGSGEALHLTEVQLEGSKRMDDSTFLRGHSLK